ncbi:MAG TPA: DUF92 domain-containing protein [Candidatus Saccharimonadales bacterium]|nr:DUF92 domain-containing protein [Candidatus Saccharimonadales bacterium]
MRTFLTLDVVGVAAAVVLGALVLVFGSLVWTPGGQFSWNWQEGLFLLGGLLVFLVASAIATGFKKNVKRRMRNYERQRGWRNVLANGLVPLLLAFALFINGPLGFPFLAVVIEFMYAGSLAAITADKFSSEIGVLDHKVVMLATLKETRPGVSGGVSVLGLLAGALGALVIGAVLAFYEGVSLGILQYPGLVLASALFIVVSGVAGNLADSLLGYFENKGIGNKYTSNFVCAAVGAAVVLLLFLFL